MTEIATDPLTGQSVVWSHGREARPRAVGLQRAEPGMQRCPFCPGHEADTPPAVMTRHDPWSIRVVPNRYPAFSMHEVIIITPDHSARTSELSSTQLVSALEAVADRRHAFLIEPSVAAVVWFQNDGPLAGATQPHPHWQLAGVPSSPPTIIRERACAAAVLAATGACGYCTRVTEPNELHVGANDEFVALSPPVPRVPYETWIIPRRHASGFDHAFPHVHDLARILLATLQAMDDALDTPDYNLYLHAVDGPDDAPGFHWHIEILPRLVRVAGFEWASGLWLNGVRAPTAAALLRAAYSGGA